MGISDEGVRLTLRLPEKLRNTLGRQALENHRSLNSEIVSQLTDSSILKGHYLNDTKSSYTVPKEEFEAFRNSLSSREKEVLLPLLAFLRRNGYF